MTVKLASTLPEGESNGLVSLVEHLINSPADLTLCVALVDTKRLTTDMDTGDVVPTARVRRIEPIGDDEDQGVIRRIMSRALERRTGKTVLPYELETSLRDAIDVDPDTGEVHGGTEG